MHKYKISICSEYKGRLFASFSAKRKEQVGISCFELQQNFQWLATIVYEKAILATCHYRGENTIQKSAILGPFRLKEAVLWRQIIVDLGPIIWEEII
ncbi:hypothetical protein BpHYR1_026161 [Brachionus plicatilis]|uniref:Uncharacterized protein n=1 Tax=Brachionus plicatilis TaxID=10195 RepID=A0A3M7T789_BRAPC|nr:hypothetical protein BpHYR1_026161 [Brachionus plicatilis]